MKDFLAGLAYVLLLLALAAMPLLWAKAVVDACGWKGFFVECRITSPQR